MFNTNIGIIEVYNKPVIKYKLNYFLQNWMVVACNLFSIIGI